MSHALARDRDHCAAHPTVLRPHRRRHYIQRHPGHPAGDGHGGADEPWSQLSRPTQYTRGCREVTWSSRCSEGAGIRLRGDHADEARSQRRGPPHRLLRRAMDAVRVHD